LPSNAKNVQAAMQRAPFSRWAGPGLSPSKAQHTVCRTRTVGHLKSYVRFSPADKRVAWVAITSANISMAAWYARRTPRRHSACAKRRRGILNARSHL
jgi:hypothetical protein